MQLLQRPAVALMNCKLSNIYVHYHEDRYWHDSQNDVVLYLSPILIVYMFVVNFLQPARLQIKVTFIFLPFKWTMFEGIICANIPENCQGDGGYFALVKAKKLIVVFRVWSKWKKTYRYLMKTKNRFWEVMENPIQWFETHYNYIITITRCCGITATTREGVSLYSSRSGGRSASRLTVQEVLTDDSGVYTCTPDGRPAAGVKVYVIHGQ